MDNLSPMGDNHEMPPAVVGLPEVEHAARLALAVFDDDRARYDAALATGGVHGDGQPLVWMLVRNWVSLLVVHHGGPDGARTEIERTLAGAIEHREEIAR